MKSIKHLNPAMLAGLNSTDERRVQETIDQLREHGNANFLPEVFSLFFSRRMEKLDSVILNFLNDIKNPDSVPFFMEGIKEYRTEPDFDKLVSACWQCGLDFSPYIDVFIDLVIEEDFYPALEAFSVIEENLSLMTSQQRASRLEYVRAKVEFLSPEKRKLVTELARLLDTFSGPFRLDLESLN